MAFFPFSVLAGEANIVHQSITSFFDRRRLFTIPSPSADKKILKNLYLHCDNKLTEDFLAALHSFREFILTSCECKKVGAEPVNGAGCYFLLFESSFGTAYFDDYIVCHKIQRWFN